MVGWKFSSSDWLRLQRCDATRTGRVLSASSTVRSFLKTDLLNDSRRLSAIISAVQSSSIPCGTAVKHAVGDKPEGGIPQKCEKGR